MGYLQYAGADFLRHGSLHCHIYIFCGDIPYHDSIKYESIWNLQIPEFWELLLTQDIKIGAPSEEKVSNVSIVEKN